MVRETSRERSQSNTEKPSWSLDQAPPVHHHYMRLSCNATTQCSPALTQFSIRKSIHLQDKVNTEAFRTNPITSEHNVKIEART